MYVIQAEGGPVKVGVATNPQKRLATLRTGTPFRLSLAHVEAIGDDLRAVNVERAAHALLSAAHAHGEWFNVTAEEATAAVQRAIVDLRRQPRPPEARCCGYPDDMLTPAQIRGARAMLTPAQSRAARALLDWSQDALATAAHLGLSTIRDFEKGRRVPSHNNLAAIVRALEEAGVQFIPENGAGPGVRLRKPAEVPDQG